MKNVLVKTGGLALLAGALTFASCKKDNNHSMMNNQDFVTKASSGNMFEIAAGNLAQRNSSNTDVKTFGSRMMTDHGKTGAQLDSLAAHKGWTIATTMQQADQNNLDSLTALTGTAFDKKFAAIMVSSHVQTINLFQKASGGDGVPDANLRAFASGTLPTLQQHLQLAQQLQNQVGK